MEILIILKHAFRLINAFRESIKLFAIYEHILTRTVVCLFCVRLSKLGQISRYQAFLSH